MKKKLETPKATKEKDAPNNFDKNYSLTKNEINTHVRTLTHTHTYRPAKLETWLVDGAGTRREVWWRYFFTRNTTKATISRKATTFHGKGFLCWWAMRSLKFVVEKVNVRALFAAGAVGGARMGRGNPTIATMLLTDENRRIETRTTISWGRTWDRRKLKLFKGLISTIIQKIKVSKY